MRHAAEFRLAFVLSISLLLASALPAPAQPAAEEAPTPQRTQLSRVKHIIVVMQENHSFDNYFGVLPYAAGTPYRSGPCDDSDHACVDGLSCTRHPTTGAYRCHNGNRDEDMGNGKTVRTFHSADYCVRTDLDHSWGGTHREVNFRDPNAGPSASPNDGFVLVNDLSNQPDTLV